jgi:hypothetical protein
MNTLNPRDRATEVFGMVLAAEDAFNELCRVYDNIELSYKRKWREERSNSQWTHGYFPNTELCMCA